MFYIPDKAQYVYKRNEAQNGRLIRKYFCSWHCLCKYEKEAEKYKPRLAFYCDPSLRKWIDEQALINNLTISQTIVRILHKAQKESAGNE